MKKIMLALAAVAMIMPAASAKTLWQGSVSFANWQVSAGERPVFAASEFAASKAGDKMVVTCTNNADDTQGWHQVELWSANVGVEGAQSFAVTNAGIQVTVATTSVEITLTDDILAKIKEGNGCALAGTGYIATQVDLQESDGVIWEGTCVCIAWNANPAVNLPGEKFALAQVGDKLVFDIAPLTPGEYSAVQIDRSTWTVSAFGTEQLTDATTQISIPLSEDLHTELVTYGINITGMNFVLTKIYLAARSEDDPVIGENNVWNGNLVVGNWDPYLEVAAAKLAKVEPGDGLLFTYTDPQGDDPCITLKQYANGWPEMPADEEWGNYLHLSAEATQIMFPVNAEAANAMVLLGMVVTGSYYTLTSIDLVKGGDDGVINIYNAEKAASSAVYNLRGVKVADSLDQLSAPGIYISNGTTTLKK